MSEGAVVVEELCASIYRCAKKARKARATGALPLALLVTRAIRAEDTIDKAHEALRLVGHSLTRDRELAQKAKAILEAHLDVDLRAMPKPGDTTEDTED